MASRGTSVLTIPVDVTQEASVSGLFAATLERCGRLDVLVNNAGTNIRHAAHELSLAQWHTVIDTNTSAFMCAKAAYPTLKHGGGGKIINIGSMMSIFGAPFAPAYAASKGGIVQLTRSLASAWARDNIQANAVLPGWIDTDLTRGAREQTQELNENVLGRMPAARWGAIDDLSGIAVFLASSASDFITGAVFGLRLFDPRMSARNNAKKRTRNRKGEVTLKNSLIFNPFSLFGPCKFPVLIYVIRQKCPTAAHLSRITIGAECKALEFAC